ncbi:MAG: hypothetical protein GXY80_05015 [Syntrophorhabdus aromaticivorans]|uniref:Uncharacterized protein n=1 Tax=Syntrophorhabdus aromaticivorans TaxID=328301 RepID=A0A971M2J2_9BACT|nr:hypothetical protein [Syntrophorhabdus aromaticivorans]
MAEQIKFTTWDSKTIDFISRNSALIKSVAASKGVSAEALAGVMAKENNPYQLYTTQEQGKDGFVLRSVDGGFVGHQLWSMRYNMVKEFDLIDNAGGSWSLLKKALFPALLDLGPVNLQAATAIRALNEYVQTHPASDPCNLKQYQGDYTKFLATIAGPGSATTGYPVTAEECARVNAVILSMQIQKALTWFENKKQNDPQFAAYWIGLPQATKDALYGQWCIWGHRRWKRII